MIVAVISDGTSSFELDLATNFTKFVRSEPYHVQASETYVEYMTASIMQLPRDVSLKLSLHLNSQFDAKESAFYVA